MEKGSLNEEEVKAVVKQVLNGLAYLHDSGYLHVSHTDALLANQMLIRSRGTSKRVISWWRPTERSYWRTSA